MFIAAFAGPVFYNHSLKKRIYKWRNNAAAATAKHD